MYEWSETDHLIIDSVRGFMDAEVRPHRDGLESGEASPYPILRTMMKTFAIDQMASETLQKIIAKEEAKEAAVAAGEEPTPSKKGTGGLGGQETMAIILTKELCAACMGLFVTWGVHMGLGVATIMKEGTLAQKKRWLPELVTFDKLAAWAITEPESGSDAFGGMRSYVKRDGDDYILNGQKTFITNGPEADVVIVYAKLDDGDPSIGKRDRKVLGFVLERGMEGFVQGKPFKKMGINSSHTGELFFDNVRLGRDRLLGETEERRGTGDGRDSAREGFVVERLGVAAMALGVIEECQRICLDYARSRELWGQPIGDFQLIQLKIANMEIARINVENMVFRGIEMGRDGKMPTLAEASAIKAYSSQAVTDVAMEAVQLLGGNGYMREYAVEQMARDAKSLMIYAGSNEVQITHIAKGLLRK
ncbi:acyl-CoA dehydrogenase family protein [Lolliginicoccus suaedae]|uniref:acyl-CoA dehydrogenase family protein n=1 Tax=Lolliginicoccus suaedae TaxID=2605429 RepID=UPI0011ECA68D|nr:acyl-CoA dehydrogenase family protein [Lolliginicoccus suaedae]